MKKLPTDPNPEHAGTIEQQLEAFCLANPRYLGLFKSASNVAHHPRSQLRSLAGLVRREIVARLGRIPGPLSPDVSRVFVDAISGDPHARLWQPTARDLARFGHSIGLVHMRARFSPDLLKVAPELLDRSWYEFVQVPEGIGLAASRRRPADGAGHGPLPWRGLFGALVRMQMRQTDRLIGTFEQLLRTSSVRAVVTTNPLVDWSHALVVAARQADVTTFCIQQGFAGTGIWRRQFCDYAIVWSPVGKMTLLQNGWPEESIIIARNPSIPPPEVLKVQRDRRRTALGLGTMDVCVLFLGQKAFDQAVEVRGYRETVDMVAKGLARACESKGIVPLVRCHTTETSGETLAILSSHCIPSLLVSRSAPLWDDLAAADVVVSMHSSAMEEAYLAGRPIVQAVASGGPPAVDFSLIGARFAQTEQELAALLVDRDWVTAIARSAACKPAADTIADHLAKPLGIRAK